MCGGGLSWRYKPTPQPGDAVRVKICRICGKRAKRPTVIITSVTMKVETVDTRENLEEKGHRRAGQRGWCPSTRIKRHHQRKRTIHTCCSREKNQIFLAGHVVRNHWSYYKNGAIAHFFLIVYVPELGRRHWATLETATLISPLEALADLSESPSSGV